VRDLVGVRHGYVEDDAFADAPAAQQGGASRRLGINLFPLEEIE
jgi:hypothetical protein